MTGEAMNTENIDGVAEIKVVGDQVRLSVNSSYGYTCAGLTSDQARRAGLALLQAAFTTCAGPTPEAKPEPKAGITRVWHAGDDEPDGVTKVADSGGDVWAHSNRGWCLGEAPCPANCAGARSWPYVLSTYGPLTEVTA